MFKLSRWMLLPSLAVAVLEFAMTRPLAAQVYSIADLGTLGGAASAATGVNNQGQVVGSSTTASGTTHAFLYTAGAMTDLGTLPGGTSSVATAINDAGQVVGFGGINEFGPQFREFTQGFIWQSGSMRSIGALFCPCSFNQRYGTSAAFGINAGAQVVGDGGTVRGESVRHAFVWQNNVMQDIGGGAGSFSVSFAYGINGAGQVVGVFDERAFLWQNGTRQDLGTLPGDAGSTGRALNGSGQVVGESVAPGAARFTAFLWDAGAMQSLGTLSGDASSRANGINASSQIVGWSGTADGSTSRAFVWERGALSDLNTLIPAGSGWVLTNATGINDVGQIVGVGLHNGQARAFLLSRLAQSAQATLVAAVLPGSRSVMVGTPATAFATVINSGNATATGCRLSVATTIAATFGFQRTNPASNQVIGEPNTPVDIAAGGAQTFVFALTPSASVAPTDVPLQFDCDNTDPAATMPGVNTILFSASVTAVPDIVAMAATVDNDGIVNLSGPAMTGAFAVATANVGVGGLITASADTGGASLPIVVSLCQTSPSGGQCVSPIGPSVPVQMDASATTTFAIFVTASAPVPFDPATNRVFVRLRDAGGGIRGSTSVAARTL